MWYTYCKDLRRIDCELWYADCGLWYADCGLWYADCKYWNADCKELRRNDCKYMLY